MLAGVRTALDVNSSDVKQLIQEILLYHAGGTLREFTLVLSNNRMDEEKDEEKNKEKDEPPAQLP